MFKVRLENLGEILGKLNPHCKQDLASEKQVPSHYPGRKEIFKSMEEKMNMKI